MGPELGQEMGPDSKKWQKRKAVGGQISTRYDDDMNV